MSGFVVITEPLSFTDDIRAANLDTPTQTVPRELLESIASMRRPAQWAGRGSCAITESACQAAIDFIAAALAESPELPVPWVGPSVLGGIGFQWDFPSASFMARVLSENPDEVYFQVEGPGQYHKAGTAPTSEVIERLRAAQRGTTPQRP